MRTTSSTISRKHSTRSECRRVQTERPPRLGRGHVGRFSLTSVTLDDNASSRLAGTDAIGALDAAYEAAWTCVDRSLLEICRDRVGMLLRHEPTTAAMPEERRANLSQWVTAEPFSEVECAALAFTEQYIVDVSGVTDELAEPLRHALGDAEFATFVNALLVVEQRMTLDLVLGAVA